MANNFTATGDYYVSKAGSDSNNGTTKNTPKATIGAAVTAAGGGKTIIVGTGTYEEAFTLGVGTTVVADGIVVLRGNGANTLSIAQGIVSGFRSIENYSFVVINSNSNGYIQLYYNAFYSTTVAYNTTSNTTGITNCSFVNCTFTQGTSTTVQATNSIFINCTSDYLFSKMTNSYWNSASTLKFVSSITAANFDYNNIEGSIVMQGGTAAGNPLTFSPHRTAYSTYNTHSFSASPQFNNVSRLDFSLQATSPHIGTSSTGNNIGGTNYAISKPINSASEWQTANGALITNLTLVGQDLTISSGQTSGSITSAPITLGTTPQTIKNLGYIGLLLFNKSQSGGSSTNNNVPDAAVYIGSDASGGGNPDKLVCEIRTSTGSTAPSTDSDWDNNGLTSPGTWIKVPIIGQPYIDTYTNGSGEPAYDANYKQTIVGTFLQMRYTLTNSYT